MEALEGGRTRECVGVGPTIISKEGVEGGSPRDQRPPLLQDGRSSSASERYRLPSGQRITCSSFDNYVMTQEGIIPHQM